MWNPFKRKSQALDTPDKIANYLQEMGASTSGEKITPLSAMQISTVFACVRVLAEAIGTLPLGIFEKQGNRTVAITDTPLSKLMKQGPNSFMTPLEYKELIVTHLALRGNHFSFKNRVAGRVVELLPLNPSSVKPYLNDDYQPEYEVTFPNGQKETFTDREIWHVRLFTDDGLNGLSPIAYNRNCLGLAKSTETHGSVLFKNAAKPAGGFKTASNLKEDQVKNLKEQLDDYKGEGAHRNLILQGGLEWFHTTMTSEDAQFLETRKYQRSEICGIFKVPPHMIGDLERATFNNIEHISLSFSQTALVPYMTRIEQRINKSLVSKPSHYAKFNTNALMRGDMKARADFYTSMIQNGALSPNEIRELEDMDAREGGDVYLTPLNMAINGKPVEESNSDNSEETA